MENLISIDTNKKFHLFIVNDTLNKQELTELYNSLAVQIDNKLVVLDNRVKYDGIKST